VAACVAAALLVRGTQSDAGEESLTAESLQSLISPERYRQAVAMLASDAMDGRRVGTPGGEAAAQFVEAGFREAGLLPGYRGGYRQDYEHSFNGATSATNVIGYLPGKDPAVGNEVIVISAHHDHLGRNRNMDGCPGRPQGDCIKRGANDNASGTAAVLELAHAFAANKDTLKRSLVFLSTDAEECGCTGVKQYVYRDPPFPLADTIFNLNIDQIGEGADLETHRLNQSTPEDEDCDVDGEVFANRGIRAQSLVGDNAHYHQCTDTLDGVNFDAALAVVLRASNIVLKEIQAP
jgi:acetylornithine deacetylase/succinyl-diaminopimelate desuccinylase-like protein